MFFLSFGVMKKRDNMPQSYKRSIDGSIANILKSSINEREKYCLSDFASRSIDASRRKNKKISDIRAEYYRDSDRIIHTHAYSRYIDKTQVFSFLTNDHITHRVLHVQLVSKIARTIGRALRLNEDLIEAISLGHDIGHVPYGHQGEACLSSLCYEHMGEYFLHNAQSIQFLDTLEDCDLTLQVLDGILCHDGEKWDPKLKPDRNKDWDILDSEIIEIKRNKRSYSPMTLEGCVVRFSDTIAYTGRDIQDAKEVGLINDFSEVPSDCRELIGVTNGEIINTLIIDLVENSWDRDYISYSPEIHCALQKYIEYNHKIIYQNPKVLSENNKIKSMYNKMFKKFLDDIKNENRESKIYEHFIDLDWINKDYLKYSSNEEKVRDFIAGMTDRYFEGMFRDMVFPEKRDDYKENKLVENNLKTRNTQLV